jgi:circadian clock protein KaiC
MPGLHTFRIADGGVQIFPRIPEQQRSRKPQATGRLSTGVPGLDEMMGGGIPAGDAVMVAGPAGSGKTTFATQFAAEGLREGEAVVVVVFEEYPDEYLARAAARSHGLEEMAAGGKLKVIYLRPLDLSVDETLAEILEAVRMLKPKRVVIDSLSGFEVALAPAFREDFRESLYRLVGALTATGVTVFMTAEIVAGHAGPVTNEKVSFITDDIIVQRFVEIGGQLRQVLVVVKMRGSSHSRDFRLYDVGARGAVVGGSLADYHGILTGAPELQPYLGGAGQLGLTARESATLDALVRLGASSLEELAVRVGSPPEDIAESLERLVTLGYVTVTKGTYRAEALANR